MIGDICRLPAVSLLTATISSIARVGGIASKNATLKAKEIKYRRLYCDDQVCSKLKYQAEYPEAWLFNGTLDFALQTYSNGNCGNTTERPIGMPDATETIISNDIIGNS